MFCLKLKTRLFLLCGSWAKAVAVFSGTVCGVAPEGIVAFWDSDAWPEILARTMAWLAGKPERKREIEGGSFPSRRILFFPAGVEGSGRT